MRHVLFFVLLLTLAPDYLQANGNPDAELMKAFHSMYSLKFTEAQAELSVWRQDHPDDPRGPVSQAAADLFAEFHRLQVLEAQFYIDDDRFVARGRLSPDPVLRHRFFDYLSEAEGLGQKRLSKDPKDRDALFALTLVGGLRADYSALIEKENLAALRETRKAAKLAERLLVIDPNCYDAYLATGMNDYIVGSLFAPVRWFLRLGGYSGDRERGVRHLKLAAERGTLLAPLARLLLAIAFLRGEDKKRARALLVELKDAYPSNPLFAKEIARIDTGR